MVNVTPKDPDELYNEARDLAGAGKYDEAATVFLQAAASYDALGRSEDARGARGLALAVTAASAYQREDYGAAISAAGQAIPLLERVEPFDQLICRALESISRAELFLTVDDLVGAREAFATAEQWCQQSIPYDPTRASEALFLSRASKLGRLSASLLWHAIRKEWDQVIVTKQQAVEVALELSQTMTEAAARAWFLGRGRQLEGLAALYRAANFLGRWRVEEAKTVLGQAREAFATAETAVGRSGLETPARKRHFDFIRGFRAIAEAYLEYAAILERLPGVVALEGLLPALVRASALCREAQRIFEGIGGPGLGLWRAVEEIVDTITTLKGRLLEVAIGQPERSLQASIFKYLDEINTLWASKWREDLFRFLEIRVAREFYEPCRGEADFTTKVAALAILFDHIDAKGIVKLLAVPPEDPKSINALEALLESSGKDGKAIVAPFRALRTIRKQYPIHGDFPEVADAYREIGVPFPIVDYVEAWERVLRFFDSALRKLHAVLQ